MTREDEFAREWTYRSPLKTVTYPKRHKAVLSTLEREAAEADGALVVPGEAPQDAAPLPRRRKKAE